jgi:hypothetical protein
MNNIESKRKAIDSKKSRNVENKKDNLKTNQNICIEILHENKVKYFNELQSIVLPKKELELKMLLDDKSKYNYTLTNIEELTQEINEIKNGTEETEYYLKTMGLLKEYYLYLDTEESKINLKVFGKKEVFSSQKMIFLERYNEINNIKIEVINSKKSDSRKRNKGVEGNIGSSMTCNNCNSFDKIIATKDHYVCTECGISQGTIISNAVAYNDRSTGGSSGNETADYKRFNYFKEILLQIQGNELTEIPQSVIDKIINELSKENITDLSKLTIEKVKTLLKKTNNSKWYEHSSLIITKITNNATIKIPVEVQEKLFYMFKKIDNDFDRHSFRANFFSFPYIIHKLFELLNLSEFYQFFPYLDDRSKLHAQDLMWKTIINGFIEKKANDEIDNRFSIQWKYIKST